MKKFSLSAKETEGITNLVKNFKTEYFEKSEYLDDIIDWLIHPKKHYLFNNVITLNQISDTLWNKIYAEGKKMCPFDSREILSKYGFNDLEEFILVPSNDRTINFYLVFKNKKEIHYSITSSIPATETLLKGKYESDRFNSIESSFENSIIGDLCGVNEDLYREFKEFFENGIKSSIVCNINIRPWQWFGLEKKYKGVFNYMDDINETIDDQDNLWREISPYEFLLAICNEIDPTQFISSKDHPILQMKTIMENYITQLANEKGLSPREIISEYRTEILTKGVKGLIYIYVKNKKYILEELTEESLGFVLDGISDYLRRAFIQISIENGIPAIFNIFTPEINQKYSNMSKAALEIVYKRLNKEDYNLEDYVTKNIASTLYDKNVEQEHIERAKKEINAMLEGLVNRTKNFLSDNNELDKNLVN